MRWRKQYENEFVRLLWQLGFVAVRTPNSGVSRLPYLDVFAWCPENGRLFAFEVKSTSKEEVDSKYIARLLSSQEIEKMRKLIDKGVDVFVVLRMKGRRYLLYSVTISDEIKLERKDIMLKELCS